MEGQLEAGRRVAAAEQRAADAEAGAEEARRIAVRIEAEIEERVMQGTEDVRREAEERVRRLVERGEGEAEEKARARADEQLRAEAERIRRRDHDAEAESRGLMRPGMGKVFKQVQDSWTNRPAKKPLKPRRHPRA